MINSIDSQYVAQLQALGLDVYESTPSINVAHQPWLADLSNLLNIPQHDISFDSNHPVFDTTSKKLKLPQNFYGNELVLKQTIWKAIQPFVHFGD